MSTPQYGPPDPTSPDAAGAAPTGPGASPAGGPDAGGYRPPSVKDAATDAAPGAPDVSAAPTGYRPPGVVEASAGSTDTRASGHVPPGAATTAPTSGRATGYRPPASAPTQPPATRAPAPAPVEPAPGPAPGAGGADPGAPAQPDAPTEPPAVPTEPPAAPTEPPSASGPNPLLRIVVGVVVLAVVGLLIAWLAGVFAPKTPRLPDRAGAYALDVTTRKSSAGVSDAATYRAAKGDVYQASLVRNAPDPATGYARAAEGTRLQVGPVYCTGVSRAGKGGTCTTLLPSGAAVSVESSSLHTAQDAARFTADVAAGVR